MEGVETYLTRAGVASSGPFPNFLREDPTFSLTASLKSLYIKALFNVAILSLSSWNFWYFNSPHSHNSIHTVWQLCPSHNPSEEVQPQRNRKEPWQGTTGCVSHFQTSLCRSLLLREKADVTPSGAGEVSRLGVGAESSQACGTLTYI